MGKSTKLIQEMFDHASLRTTEIYIQNIDNDLKGIADGILENTSTHFSTRKIKGVSP